MKMDGLKAARMHKSFESLSWAACCQHGYDGVMSQLEIVYTYTYVSACTSSLLNCMCHA